MVGATVGTVGAVGNPGAFGGAGKSKSSSKVSPRESIPLVFEVGEICSDGTRVPFLSARRVCVPRHAD